MIAASCAFLSSAAHKLSHIHNNHRNLCQFLAEAGSCLYRREDEKS
jgi:hypothetical protein